ncbi:MAG: hypothetical protein UX79_C0002G0003 [candidate division WWE3 bacterium GW2011_GWB1_47_11]|uniref:Bacterial membrane protein YfhO n=2 Tax=Bacteria candidate phyla TaxID=1783234 RepID=A0A0G0RQZ7_9BACT|nr:MAG: hypothetical protein UT92_C0010G0003 [Candidatus Curtissbacteria bacterium GW2011_GWA1_40_24]KKU57992.1 MAG: hypothetical protein UX79_C0002G0003 [candidate division WWE3 bacterium GW2011_GWB1_47_11]
MLKIIKNNYEYFAIAAFVLVTFGNSVFFHRYIFGDTAIYALHIAGLAKNLVSVFGFKDNFLLWNPAYLSVGIPTLGVVDLGVLYPPNVLIAVVAFLLKDPMIVFPLYTISIYIHLVFGSIFVLKLLTDIWNVKKQYALLGAFLWAFAGYNMDFMPAASIFLAASYLPLCLYLKLKRGNGALYYLFLAASFLAGYPIVTIIIAGMCFIYPLLSRNTNTAELGSYLKSDLLGLLLITVPIIAPLYFTAAFNLKYTTRSSLTLEGFLQNPAPLSNLLESVYPKNTPLNDYSKTNLVYLYFSATGILLALFCNFRKIISDRKNVLLLIIGIVTLIISLGSLTPLPAFLYLTLPGFGMFRRLAVFSLVPAFVYCLLVPQFAQKQVTILSKKVLLGIFSLSAFALVTSLVTRNVSLAFITAITLGTLIAIYMRQKSTDHFMAVLGLTLLFEASFISLSKAYINSSVNPQSVFRPGKITNEIVKIIKPMERVDLMRTQYNYSTTYLNVEQTSGYVSLASFYGAKITEALNNADIDPTNLRDVLGVKYVISKEKDREVLTPFEKINDASDFYSFNYNKLEWEQDPPKTQYAIYKRDAPLQRLFLANSTTQAKQDKDVLIEISQAKNPRDVFVPIWQPEGKFGNLPGNVNIVEYKRNYIKAIVELRNDGFLVNSTAYYPGWWAKINGKWVLPTQTNWFMMGTYVPGGRSTVEYMYIPYGVIAGGLYAVAGLGILVVFSKKYQFWNTNA